MSNGENVQAVRRLFDAFYAADEEAMSGLIGDDFVTHAPGGGTGNASGWKAMAVKIADAIPDNRTEIDDVFGDGDKVAVRYTSRGTHTGELFGVSQARGLRQIVNVIGVRATSTPISCPTCAPVARECL